MENKGFDQIIFDLDSTLVTIEGLDWLAKKNGQEKEVSELTKQSMDGQVKLEEVFPRKVDMIAPSRKEVVALGEKYCRSTSEDVIELIKLFHWLNKEVWILTGNFKPAVSTLAAKLGILPERVMANSIYFDQQGGYLDFNRHGPLSRSGGKAEKLKQLRQNQRRRIFVGDSVADLEARKEVDLFVGYGGVVEREKVREKSPIYIRSKSLCPLLLVVLSSEERDKIMATEHYWLIGKAERLNKEGCLIQNIGVETTTTQEEREVVWLE